MPRRPWSTSAALVGAAALVASIATPAHAAPDPGAWLKPGVPITYEHPDPSITTLGPMTFSYATNHGGTDLPVLWSADATTWTARTQYDGVEGTQDGDTYGWFNDAFPTVPWGIDYDRCNAAEPGCDPKELWAPSVAFVGTHWVAFHAVKVAREPAYSPYGRFAIYASVADNPLGPFRAASSSPIVSTNSTLDVAGAIDPDVFVDEVTGKAYLLWKTEGNLRGNYPAIWARQLDSSGTRFASGSTARKLMTVSQAWEGTVVENPSLTKVAGRYVLLYSGNDYTSTSSGTGYAICSSPLGPCTKSSSNPIIRSASGAWSPTGADGLVDQRGRFIATYHAWTGASGGRGQGQRRQHVMELTTSATGGVRVIRRDLSGGAGADFLWRHAEGGAATSTPMSVGGTYVPAAGDFDGDGRSDIFWYGEWTRSDSIWTGRADGRFGGRAADQRGTFVPLAGDFDGDGLGDIYWYQPGPDPIAADPSRSGDLYEPNARNDQLWRSTGTGWTVTDLSMPWAANPVVGDFDGSGTTDILWVQPGTGADRLWRFDHDGRPTSSSVSIAGDYRPVVGDFDGNGVDDVFWYGPGARPDSIWWFDGQARYRITQQRVTGEQYRPFAGDFDGDGHDDLFWYAPGPGNDYRWSAITSAGSYRSVGTTATGIYQPVVGDYDGNGVDDIVWYS